MRLRLFITTLAAVSVSAGAVCARETDAPSLKQRYLDALTQPTNLSDPASIAHDLVSTPGWSGQGDLTKVIMSAGKDGLLADPDIRRALIKIRDGHPVSDVRAQASTAILSDPEDIGANVFGAREVNKDRTYCTAQSVGATPIPPLEASLRDKLLPLQQSLKLNQDGQETETRTKMETVDVFANEVSDGWLTGYGKVKGLGLHYVPRDEAVETTQLLGGTIHAIFEKKGTDSLFVLSTRDRAWTPGRQCWIPTELLDVKKTAPGEFDIVLQRTLPSGLETVSRMKNGDLFLTFAAGCRWGSMPVDQGDFGNNPPIGLTNQGQIYAVCEKTSEQKRW